MKKTLYFISQCIRCGEMPLFMVFYHDRKGAEQHSVMLCSFKNMKKLMKYRFKGFAHPKEYGQVLYNGHGKPSEIIREILKSRYDFDLEYSSSKNISYF